MKRIAPPSSGPLATVRVALERDCQPRGPDDRYVALCPSHDDRVPSLSVSEGADGRALLHCHAGCSTEHILAALGLHWTDLFPDRLHSPHWRPLRDRYTKLAGRFPAELAKVQARRAREADVLLHVLVQLLRDDRTFTGSLAFTCPYCGTGHAWARYGRTGIAIDCDAGCSEDDVLSALVQSEKAA